MLLLKQFKLDINGLHGLSHWKKVESLGLKLSQGYKADIKIIKLFSYLHDSQRIDEDFDPEHGQRSAVFIKNLFKQGLLNITKQQLNQLIFACRFHNNSKIKSNNITIQICWDADRLDLARTGILPDVRFLNSLAGKEMAG